MVCFLAEMKQICLLSLVLVLTTCSPNTNRELENHVLEAELEFKIEAELGEGALWNYKSQELYWVDIEGKTLNLYSPTTKKNKVIVMPSRIGTVVPVDSNTVLTALENGVYKTDIETGSSELFVDMKKELNGKRLNDGKCDPNGRFWVGSMHLEQTKGSAQLFAIDHKGQLEMKIDSVTISNGIVWTADKTTMYYIDTPTSEIKSYKYDVDKGTISNANVVMKFSESLGHPDGMTIDAEDKLWVGMWNGKSVLRIDPNIGKVIKTIEVPALNVTSCAFGGDDLDILYITSARVGMTEEELQKYPLSGSVFKVRPGVKGVKCLYYKEQVSIEI
jgi:sugar lactone lactonase YvrE